VTDLCSCLKGHLSVTVSLLLVVCFLVLYNIQLAVVQPRPVLARSTTQSSNKVVSFNTFIGQQGETMTALVQGLREYVTTQHWKSHLNHYNRLKLDEAITKQTLNSLESFSKSISHDVIDTNLTNKCKNACALTSHPSPKFSSCICSALMKKLLAHVWV